MARILSVLNALVLAGTVFWNYYSNTGAINGQTVGEVSDNYTSLFTPAGFTFAIWALIYIALIAQAVFMLVRAFNAQKSDDFVGKAAPWLILTNLANCTWMWFWLHEEIAVSVIIMLFILLFLIITVLRLNMERWDAPLPVITFVWWPVCFYIGWISIATIANVSAYLNSLGWTGGIQPETWAIIMIGVGIALNLFMVFARNMREFAAVGIWAFFGIAARHWGGETSIQYVAVAGMVILIVANMVHAWRNRDTLPFIGQPGKASAE